MKKRGALRSWRWMWVALWVGCGGGGDTSGDVGAAPDPGPSTETRPDTSGCQVKEDCPVQPCRLAVCLAGACEYQAVPEGAACSDPGKCLFAGVCDNQGVCQGEWACDDGNSCTTDRCDEGKCVHEPMESGPCDDGDPCSEGDACVMGTCQPGTRSVCDCKEDRDCPTPTDLCLGRLECDPDTKKCVPDPGAKVSCPDSGNPCSPNECDPKTGQCRKVVLKDGTGCDAGPCQVEAACKNGECVGRDKCPSVGCEVGVCDPENGECTKETALDGTPCDDGNPCTAESHCEKGVCTGQIPPEVCNGKDDNCDGYTDGEGAQGCKVFFKDNDQDGAGDPSKSKCLCEPTGSYTAQEGDDCDDANPLVHPGVAEVCNGKDDDCDGATDEEDSGGCTRYYKDLDGDGWGVTESKCLCGPSTPYFATKTGDCDDSNGMIHPGAEEVCNLVDDDCNAETDEGEGKSGCKQYWPDQDQDGFGDSPPKCLCGPQGSYTADNHSDCDDSNKNIHPGATEVCNQKDDDCDGPTDEGENLTGCQSYYMDSDKDGYGAGTPKCLCKPDGLYVVTQAGDCGAGDPAIHPGGHVCGKDGDCDGKLPDAGEPCDDGNTTTWDGCNGSCEVVEFQVNAYYVDDQENPDVAFPGTVGDSGSFIAWEGVGCVQWFGIPPKCNETEDGIWVRRYDGSGQSLRLELANTYKPGSQRNPAVSASANGAVVVWEGQGSDTETSEIYFRRFNPDGTPKENFVTRVNGVTDGTQRYPDVVADHYLNFRVVWETKPSAGNSSIALRAFTSNLTAWPEMTVNVNTSGDRGRPCIADFDGGNRFVVVWQSYSTTYGFENIFARRFLWNTTALDSFEFQVNPYSMYQRQPRVAGNRASGGGFVVVSTGKGSGSVGDDIWARAYHSDGTPVVGAAVRVNEVTSGDQTQPDVAMAADGSFVVVWYHAGDIYLRRFKSDQTPASGEVRVNVYSAVIQSSPSITGASNGTVLVGWDSQNQDGSGLGVFAQRFGPNGERLFR